MIRGRWIVTPTGLVPAADYVRPLPSRSSLPTPMLIRDSMEPTWNPVDGKTYDSRSSYYREVKTRGGEIIGNDTASSQTGNRVDVVTPSDVASDVKRAFDELS